MSVSSFAIAAKSRLTGMSVAGATALAVILGGPANAADFSMPYKAPLLLPGFSWSGFYVGGQAGYAFGKDHLVEYFTASGAFTGFERKYNPKGATGGLYGGYNYQAGRYVFGLETDIEASDIRNGWIDLPTGGSGDTKIDWQGSLRGRIGVASDKVLVYGTGGLAYGNVSHTYTNLLTRIVETTAQVRTGWTAGGGIEVAVTPNVLMRVEYRYTDFGMSRYSSVTSFPGLTGTQQAQGSTVRVGAAYKF